MPYASDMAQASDAKVDRMILTWRGFAPVATGSIMVAAAIVAVLVYTGNSAPGSWLGAALVLVVCWPVAVAARMVCAMWEADWQGERDKRTERTLRSGS